MSADDFVPIPGLIAAHAKSNSQGIAFREGVATLTWQMLDGRISQVARYLLSVGVQAGDRVAILSTPSLAYVECFFGIIAARACVVPLPVSASRTTLETILANSGARVLFLDDLSSEVASDLAQHQQQQLDCKVIWLNGREGNQDAYATWIQKGKGEDKLPHAEPEDRFNIIYSSGTTGTPKGIVHSHGMRQRQAMRGGFGFSTSSRLLLSTPMYSNTTITPLLGSLVHGGEAILMRKFDAGQWLKIASQLKVTHTMLVPVQYQRLLDHPDFERSDLSSLQLSQSTGAPMSAALKREILKRWPGKFREVYGLTEGGVSCFLDARQHPDKLGTVGVPVHGTEVFLIDEEGRRLPTQTGVGNGVTIPSRVTGEVVGRSPFMMTEYFNQPDASAEIRWLDAEGHVYHRTGDIGYFDQDGFLTLLDRKKDVIISGGNNIYAVDLETVLVKHPAVLEVAVIGVPSAQWGETPLALVVLKPGMSIDGEVLRVWANAQLGKTQRISALELRNELGRNALGKLSKKQLRDQYWDQSRAP